MDKFELRKLIEKTNAKKPRASAFKHTIYRMGRVEIKVTDEGLEQFNVAEWLRFHKIPFLHPANEARRNRLLGIMLKLLGLEPGAADLIIFRTPPRFPDKKGVAIEMKSLTGKATKDQMAWLDMVEREGYVTAICPGAWAAINLLEELGYGGWNDL